MRRRWRWGSVLAVVCGLLALTACSGGPTPPSGSSLPPSVESAGRRVPFDGLQAWTLASVPSRDATRLTVFATGSDDGGSACGPAILRLHAVETATTVRVSVGDYQEKAGPMTACPAVGYAPSPQPLTLQRPLGDRTLVDASTGKRPTLLVAADYPTLVAPKGFTALPFGQVGGVARATQEWVERGEIVLRLDTTTPASVRDDAPYGRIVRRFTIGGSAAALYISGTGRSGQAEVQWTPNDRQTISLRFDNASHRRWSADEEVALARAVTNYRTEPTGRLPQPSTPGTAVATYSSVDGLVHHASNMWKSSGIYIGIDCVGQGTVTVSLRGTSYPFACVSQLRHQVAESIGSPNDEFFLDVAATKGVRWTVVLARASLDGS